MTIAAALLALALTQDWPTLHRDAQRSGFSDTVPPGPYERKWYRDVDDERLASRGEALSRLPCRRPGFSASAS